MYVCVSIQRMLMFGGVGVCATSSMLLHLENCLFIHLSLHPSVYIPWQSSRMPSRRSVMQKTELLSTSYSQTLECSRVKVTLRPDDEPCMSVLQRAARLNHPPTTLLFNLIYTQNMHTYSIEGHLLSNLSAGQWVFNQLIHFKKGMSFLAQALLTHTDTCSPINFQYISLMQPLSCR